MAGKASPCPFQRWRGALGATLGRGDGCDLTDRATLASSRSKTMQRLELDVTTIVGVHGNPVPMAQFVEFMSRRQ